MGIRSEAKKPGANNLFYGNQIDSKHVKIAGQNTGNGIVSVLLSTVNPMIMADKQKGTGARGDRSGRPKGQGASQRGNDTKPSMDNRSQQIKNDNKSTARNDAVAGRS